MKRRCKIAVLLFVLISTASVFADVDLGNSRVPETATFGGVEVAPGTYNFQLVEGSDGEYIQISKADKVIAKQIAIIIHATEAAEKPVIQITKPDNRNYLRIRIRSGENWYFAYMTIH